MKASFGLRGDSKSAHVRYCVTLGIFLLLAVTLQTSLFSRMRLFGAVPDMMLCAVLCISYFCGRYTGGIVGIAAGFLTDALGSTGISLLPFCYFLLGYFVGHYARGVSPKRFTNYVFFLAASLMYRAAVTVVSASLSYEFLNLPQLLLHAVLPELLYTAIVGCILYAPVKLLERTLLRKR